MKLVLPVLSLFLFLTATAQPRFTDSTFGTNGKVIENSSKQRINLIDALLQPDGKTLILSTTNDYYNDHTILIRYNIDGTPDTNFDGDGVADSLFLPGFNCNSYAIRLQSDGKILVCGGVDSGITSYAFVMRYNSNGSLDVSFGISGVLYIASLTFNSTSIPLYAIEDLAVLPNGKLTLLCNRSYPYSDIALIRLNSDGTYDNSFGSNGIAVADLLVSASGYQQYKHIEVLTNGKYIIAGSPGTTAPSGADQPYIVVRLNANGSLDNTYGTGGSVRLTGGSTSDQIEDMLIQPDGKVIISGSENAYASHAYNTIVRITANGAPDASFGNSGKTVLHFSAIGFSSVQAHLGLQADGKILIGGVARNGNDNYSIAAARLTNTGILDAGFDGDGIALMQVNGYNSYGYVPLPQSDGNITIAGYAYKNSFTSITIGRFTATGQTDGSFSAATAVIVFNDKIYFDNGSSVLIQPADQKIVSVRERTNGHDYDLCVSRHLATGQPDTSFGQNGKTFINLPGSSDFYVYSGISSDGKITIIPYYFDYVSGGKLAVFRLKANGQSDSSFGLNGKKLFRTRNTDTIFNSMRYAVVQPDGKTLIATTQHDGPVSNPNAPDSTFLIRLNIDGSFDNSFGISGRKFISAAGSNLPLILQTDGKILLAISGSNAASTPQTILKRFNANGSTDATFNSGQDKVLNTSATQLVLQPNGKIVLASYRKNITRLLNNSNYDTTFGTNGIVDVTSYNPSSDYNYSFNVAADSSRIMLMTSLYDSVTPYDYYSKVIALKNNGSSDSTFGETGVAIPDFSPAGGNGYHLALQADRKVVVIGSESFTTDVPSSGFVLTRLKSTNTSTGRLYTFTGSGLWSTPANWADGTVPPTTIPAGNSIVIDPPTGSECVIDITVHVQTGASVTVKAGKKVRLPGNLIIQ